MSRWKLNHSRYIDNGAEDISNSMYESARRQPTHKQVKFYNSLYGKCKDNNIDATTNHAHTRAGYARAIDMLLQRLQEAEIDVYGNGKEGKSVLMIGEDKKGRFTSRERIVVEEKNPDNESLSSFVSEARYYISIQKREE